MQRAETDACRVWAGRGGLRLHRGRRREKGAVASRLQQMCMHTHTHTQLCRSASVHSQHVCVCVWLAVTCWSPTADYASVLSQPLDLPLPLPRTAVRCLVSSFCFQTGVKETNHLHTALPLLCPSSCYPSPSLIQQINGHKARAALWDEQGNLRGVQRVGVATPSHNLSASPRKL